ncbi:hypothetical protein AGMMS49546_09230 [Spirochaetia bacterium]|nr:hypothetical protein AGMMS49546_09230 [Spirochaetia bacterium]
MFEITHKINDFTHIIRGKPFNFLQKQLGVRHMHLTSLTIPLKACVFKLLVSCGTTLPASTGKAPLWVTNPQAAYSEIVEKQNLNDQITANIQNIIDNNQAMSEAVRTIYADIMDNIHRSGLYN